MFQSASLTELKATHDDDVTTRLSQVLEELSISEVAKAADVSCETVRRAKHGANPNAKIFIALSRDFGVNGDWLLTGRGPMLSDQVRKDSLTSASPSELLIALANAIERNGLNTTLDHTQHQLEHS